MSKKFELIDRFKGYVTKPDETNTSARRLVSGSKNVLINDAEKVTGRKGYTLLGASSTATTPIISSFEWPTHNAREWMLRSYDDELEVYLETIDTVAVNAWTRVADSWTAVDFNFATWWDNTEGIDLLLFVNGDDKIYEWNGAVTTISATTASTITKNGTETWGEAGFYTTRNKTVIINGTEYAYTGGESTTTLTGVTPDPTGEANNSVVIQKIVTNDNQPADGGQNDLIATLNNQVYVGSLITRTVDISSNTDFTDFTFSSPRTPGEGAALTLDNATVGFIPQEQDMYITAGKDDWYRTNFDLKTTSSAFIEDLSVKKLKTGPQQAAQTQAMTAKIKNSAVYISNEPTLDELGRLENLETPQSKPLSDPIKPDFNAATFTNAHVKYWRNAIYVAVPSDSELYIYDIEKGFWQPPQVIGGGVRRLAVWKGDLYGHSSTNPETYKLFDGTSDGDNGIIAYNASFAYRNFGERANQKEFDEYFTEGYISSATVLDMTLKYDYKGGTSEQTFTIDGSDENFLFGIAQGAGLGKVPLGHLPLGGGEEAGADLKKFRIIHETRPTMFYEMQTVYETTSADAQFEILSQGPNARLAPDDNLDIKSG